METPERLNAVQSSRGDRYDKSDARGYACAKRLTDRIVVTERVCHPVQADVLDASGI
jgi:hypothetical protein